MPIYFKKIPGLKIRFKTWYQKHEIRVNKALETHLQTKQIAAKAEDVNLSPEKISPTLKEFYAAPDQTDFGKKTLAILKQIVYHIMDEAKVSAIKWNEVGQGSHYNPETHEIYFDPALVSNEKDLTELKFVASHEVSHAVITKYSSLIKEVLKDEAPLLEQYGYSSLCNAIEDPRVNDWAKREYAGAKAWQKQTYDPMFEKDNTVLGGGEIIRRIIEKLGYVPLFVRYQSEIIRWWHTTAFGEGRFSNDLEPKVKELLDKTKNDFEKAYQLLPKDRSQTEIDRTAKESFQIIHEKIWNGGYRELMEEVLKLEELNQMLQNPQTAQEAWDQLSDAEKGELLDNMQQAGAKPGEGMEPSPDGSSQSIQIDPNKLSPELREKLEKILKSLDAEKQKKLKEQSGQAIGEVEDKLNDGYESDFNGDPMPRHGKPDANADPNASSEPELDPKAADQAKKALEEMNKTSLNRDHFTDLNQYDRTLIEFAPEINKLVHDLQMILRANESPRFTSGHDSGQRINLDKAMQFTADKSQYKIFDKRRTPTVRDFHFTFLLDTSGSMSGEKINNAFKAFVMLCEAFHRLGLAIEIIGFKKKPFLIKNSEEPLDQKLRQKLGEIPRLAGGGNADAEAVEFAYERIKKGNQPKDFSYLIVISDGLPTDSNRGENAEEALHQTISQINGERLIPSPIGLGLGGDTEHVADYYKIALPGIKPKDLGKAFADLMRDLVENPYKYSGDEHYRDQFGNVSNPHFMGTSLKPEKGQKQDQEESNEQAD